MCYYLLLLFIKKVVTAINGVMTMFIAVENVSVTTFLEKI